MLSHPERSPLIISSNTLARAARSAFAKFPLGLAMRSLVPYFFISTHPVGWKCSVCGKIFRVPLNILGKPTTKPDDDVHARFEAHSCLAYRDELQRKREEAGGSDDADDDSLTGT